MQVKQIGWVFTEFLLQTGGVGGGGGRFVQKGEGKGTSKLWGR